MYLKKLYIKYFRCFKSEEGFEVEFAPRVTVLFGKNGSGKSTLIHAIHKALSFVFDKNIKDTNSFDLSSGFPELRVEQFIQTDGVRNPKTGLMYPDIDIKVNGSFLGLPLEWEIYALTSTYKLQYTKYKKAYGEVINRISETNILPFFAYYSDSFPHIPKLKPITQQQMELRNLGYLDWNLESACSEIWISRLNQKWTLWDRADRNVKHAENALKNCDYFLSRGTKYKKEFEEDILLHKEKLQRALKEREIFDKEVSEIKSCLIKFSKGDTNFEIINVFTSIYDGELWIETKLGNNRPFHLLPAGYKRLYYMVLDIAYRSYILNGTTDAKGVVAIDEIDLHLHPELEQVVLERFMNTFPNLQFIVSTHSPLVLTGLETEGKPNKILRMEPNTNAPVLWPDVYGIDYNSGLEDIMGVESKNANLDHLLSLCAYMRKRGKTTQADNIKQRIIDQFAKNSDELEKLIEKKEKGL